MGRAFSLTRAPRSRSRIRHCFASTCKVEHVCSGSSRASGMCSRFPRPMGGSLPSQACRSTATSGSSRVLDSAGARRRSRMNPTPAPRLHLIQASDADVAVIFRRGPSKRVELVRWDTKRDVFERGHWFHGRIYERRSDLSPDGELLVYFASKLGGRPPSDPSYTYAWTAVSKPPWLTALALWPKGNCWHGGGLFLGKRRLLLNHRPEVALPHPNHEPAHHLDVVPNPLAQGEDEPMYAQRLTRDGWKIIQEWDVEWL